MYAKFDKDIFLSAEWWGFTVKTNIEMFNKAEFYKVIERILLKIVRTILVRVAGYAFYNTLYIVIDELTLFNKLCLERRLNFLCLRLGVLPVQHQLVTLIVGHRLRPVQIDATRPCKSYKWATRFLNYVWLTIFSYTRTGFPTKG